MVLYCLLLKNINLLVTCKVPQNGAQFNICKLPPSFLALIPYFTEIFMIPPRYHMASFLCTFPWNWSILVNWTQRRQKFPPFPDNLPETVRRSTLERHEFHISLLLHSTSSVPCLHPVKALLFLFWILQLFWLSVTFSPPYFTLF